MRFVTRAGVRVLIDSAAGIVIALLDRLLARRAGRGGGDAGGHRARPTSSGGCRPRRAARDRASRAARIAARARRWRATRTGAAAGVLGHRRRRARGGGAAGALLRRSTSRRRAGRLLAPLAGACSRSSAVVAATRGLARVARDGAARPSPCCAGPRSASARRLRLGGRLRGPAAPGSPWRAAGARGGERRGAGGERRRRAAHARLSPRSSRRCATTPARWASATTSPRACPPTARPRSGAARRRRRRAALHRRRAPTPSRSASRVKLVAFPGDHTRFEEPPLDAGRRRARQRRGRGRRSGWPRRSASAWARPSPSQLPSGGEARFRVVGTVRALDDNGRVAYVRPARVLAADPGATPQVVVKLARGADRAAVDAPAGDARRAAGRRRRRHDAQRRPSSARSSLCCGWWRSSTRSSACMRWCRAWGSWPASAGPRSRCCAPPAPRAPPWARSWRAPRCAVALPAAVLALALERLVLAPARRAPGRRLRRRRPAVLARPGRAGPRRAGAAGRRGRRVGRAPCHRRAAAAGAEGGVMRAARHPRARRCCRAAGCGGSGSRPAASDGSTLSATLARPRRRRLPDPRARASRCATARTSRRATRPGRTLATLADPHRRARPRRGVARAGAVPRPPRRPLLLDLPPAGGALRRRCSTPPCAR